MIDGWSWLFLAVVVGMIVLAVLWSAFGHRLRRKVRQDRKFTPEVATIIAEGMGWTSPPDPRKWTLHLDYSGEPMRPGEFREPPDWRELGRTEYLNAKHMPDRMCRIYPTQDRWSPEDEREFLAGWNEAAAADKLMHDERTPGD